MKFRSVLICAGATLLLGLMGLSPAKAETTKNSNLTIITTQGNILNNVPGVRLKRIIYVPSSGGILTRDILPPPYALKTVGFSLTKHIDNGDEVDQNYVYDDVDHPGNGCAVFVRQFPDGTISGDTVFHGNIGCTIETPAIHRDRLNNKIEAAYILYIQPFNPPKNK